jgi:hypothetical protein
VKQKLRTIRDLIQQDVGNRGLAKEEDNLINACPYDFEAACQSIAEMPNAAICIVTGFLIPTANPPRAETDGPLGALFLARAFSSLGIRVTITTDWFCMAALEAGLNECFLEDKVRLIELPREENEDYVRDFRKEVGPHSHLIALERVGPSHTPDTILTQLEGTSFVAKRFRREVSPDDHGRCFTMGGIDITEKMSPAHLLFENPPLPVAEFTIGIGDGGNEIGMGKISWQTIFNNIPQGGKIACRVPTDYLIVAGISNWGAYALATGVYLLKKNRPAKDLFDLSREEYLLRLMVDAGPLVDGVKAIPSPSVDGLDFDNYIKPLRQLAELVN